MKYNLSEVIKTFSLTLLFASVMSLIVLLTSLNMEITYIMLMAATYSFLPFEVVVLNPFCALLFLIASGFFYKMGIAVDSQ